MKYTKLSHLIAATALLCVMLSSTSMAQDLASQTRAGDASADRGIFFNRAETIGEGNTTFNAYELLFAGVTHAWSNDGQATLNFLIPITQDFPTFLLGNAKFVVARAPNLTLAIQGEASYLSEGDLSAGAFGAAGILDYYVSPKFVLHTQLGLDTIWGEVDDTDEELNLAAGKLGLARIVGGFHYVASDLVRLNLEVALPAAYGDGKLEFADDAILFYGVRFAGKSLSADLGFVRPVIESVNLVTGLPWVSFAARF